MTRDGGVDLHRQADFPRPVHGIERPMERAGQGAENVMGSGG